MSMIIVQVTCVGFPVGGENISVTRGVVSRVDVNIDGTTTTNTTTTATTNTTATATTIMIIILIILILILIMMIIIMIGLLRYQIDAAINPGNSGGPVAE